MPLSAGTRLGPYEILSALGGGGMGEVYQTGDTKLNTNIAIQVIPDFFAHSTLIPFVGGMRRVGTAE